MKRAHWIILFEAMVIEGWLLLGTPPTKKWKVAEEKTTPSNADRRIGETHDTLRRFFAREGRFSRPFEGFCRILEEHGFGYDPRLAFPRFWGLWNGHRCFAAGMTTEEDHSFLMRHRRGKDCRGGLEQNAGRI